MSVLLSEQLTVCYGLHKVYTLVHLLRSLSTTYQCLMVFFQFAVCIKAIEIILTTDILKPDPAEKRGHTHKQMP